MKSIVQEASSIARAVEQGWQKAGCPAQFSVKILELPETNFFGFTRRSAKVAIYFDEKPKVEHAQEKSGYTKPKYTREPREKKESQPQHEPRERHPQQPQRERQAPQQQHAEQKPERPQPKRAEPMWNNDMIACAEKWLHGTLRAMHLEHIQFKIQPQQFHLRITFNEPLLPDMDREKQLFASFSALILETLRKEFKTGFRGHKIVLTHVP